MTRSKKIVTESTVDFILISCDWKYGWFNIDYLIRQCHKYFFHVVFPQIFHSFYCVCVCLCARERACVCERAHMCVHVILWVFHFALDK